MQNNWTIFQLFYIFPWHDKITITIRNVRSWMILFSVKLEFVRWGFSGFKRHKNCLSGECTKTDSVFVRKSGWLDWSSMRWKGVTVPFQSIRQGMLCVTHLLNFSFQIPSELTITFPFSSVVARFFLPFFDPFWDFFHHLPKWFRQMARSTVTCVTFRWFRRDCYVLLPNWSKWYTTLISSWLDELRSVEMI